MFKLRKSCSISNFVLFDSLGRIRRYSDAHEILDEYYSLRLEGYCSRKSYLIHKLTRELERVSNRVKFVEAIISGDLQIVNIPKQQLLARLHELGFKPFPKISDTQATKSLDQGHSEKVKRATKEVNGPCKCMDEGFGYLLCMQLWTLTKEKAEELKNEKQQIQNQLDRVVCTTAESMWEEDLDKFMEVWDQHLIQLEKAESEGNTDRASKARDKTFKKEQSKKDGLPARYSPEVSLWQMHAKRKEQTTVELKSCVASPQSVSISPSVSPSVSSSPMSHHMPSSSPSSASSSPSSLSPPHHPSISPTNSLHSSASSCSVSPSISPAQLLRSYQLVGAASGPLYNATSHAFKRKPIGEPPPVDRGSPGTFFDSKRPKFDETDRVSGNMRGMGRMEASYFVGDSGVANGSREYGRCSPLTAMGNSARQSVMRMEEMIRSNHIGGVGRNNMDMMNMTSPQSSQHLMSWRCQSCTFENFNANGLACELCQSRRYVLPGDWRCHRCMNLNDIDSRVCLRCQSSPIF